jgi:hypothetical protein
MEGFDRYYRKEWAGEQEKGKAEARGFWMVQLVLGDFGGAKSLSWGEFGSRGGGNYGENGKTEAAVARRLWTGDEFTGVPGGNLRAKLEQYGLLAAEYSYRKRELNDIVFHAPDCRGLGSFIWEPTRHHEAIFDQGSRNAGGGSQRPTTRSIRRN